MTESLIIGYDQANRNDMACMTVRTKNDSEILSTFYGEEAIALYEKLTGSKCDLVGYTIIEKDLYERLKELFPVNPIKTSHLYESLDCCQLCEFGPSYNQQAININSDMLIHKDLKK